MPNCTRCGAQMEGYSASGFCPNCEASSPSHGSGAPADVPCQRCGMYLPSHELRMWNSRLYCAYCIMDVQDEEKRARAIERRQETAAHAPEAPSPAHPNLPQGYSKLPGTCERCGREADTLYTVGGRLLCEHCASEQGGTAPAESSALGVLASAVKSALGFSNKPKEAEKINEQVFDIGKRKMISKSEGDLKGAAGKTAEPFGSSSGASSEKPGAESSKTASERAPSEVFDLRDRKMVEKKEGMEGESPLSENPRDEGKPAGKKTKKLFFKMHPSSGGSMKKK